MEIKLTQLRKLKGISQQELADYLGVTSQAVSKWETKSSLPDITLLPLLAEYFQVSVDEILGLVPIRSTTYLPRNTDNRTQWSKMIPMIHNNRAFFWNDDYLEYLVKTVWKIDRPIDVIELCCCDADLGKRLMRILPEGSTYTGVDSECLIQEARNNLDQETYPVELIVADIYTFHPDKHYDMSISQAAIITFLWLFNFIRTKINM